jgi:hypothetical protein
VLGDTDRRRNFAEALVAIDGIPNPIHECTLRSLLHAPFGFTQEMSKRFIEEGCCNDDDTPVGLIFEQVR